VNKDFLCRSKRKYCNELNWVVIGEPDFLLDFRKWIALSPAAAAITIRRWRPIRTINYLRNDDQVFQKNGRMGEISADVERVEKRTVARWKGIDI
jgi:hypothetical protein